MAGGSGEGREPPGLGGRQPLESELGRLGEIGPAERLRALQLVERGRVWSLGLAVRAGGGFPDFPGRPPFRREVYRDWSHYLSGEVGPLKGGVCSVDDGVVLGCHAGSHLDALGHIICEGSIAGGVDAATTVGELHHADVAALGHEGVICRAVLADVARWKGVEYLARDCLVTSAEVRQCLSRQGVEVKAHDLLLIRTGSLLRFEREGAEAFFDHYSEPGLGYEEELLSWIDEVRLLGIGTDTLANEIPTSPTTGEQYVLHRHLLRDRGLQFHEALWLEDVAAACAEDGRYEGLYLAMPLKLVGASGSPINPLFVK